MFRYLYLSSSELLKLSFHPSCLLTLGDTLAFTRLLTNHGREAHAGPADAGMHVAVNEKPPSLEEQMAMVSGSVMARVPQR
jgi:hypothetical protein